MRAIAFLVAAFAFLAACNRPVTAERVAATERASPPQERASPPQRAGIAAPALRPSGRETAGSIERPIERRIADSKLTEDVREALLAEKGLTTRDLQVTARDGVVTISGTIEERSDQDRMLLVAKSVEGVRSVATHLLLDRPTS